MPELPRTSGVCALPSTFTRNRCEAFWGSSSARRRLLSKTILVPSGDRAGKLSMWTFSVRRRTFEPSPSIRYIWEAYMGFSPGGGAWRVLTNAMVEVIAGLSPRRPGPVPAPRIGSPRKGRRPPMRRSPRCLVVRACSWCCLLWPPAHHATYRTLGRAWAAARSEAPAAAHAVN